jgi:hypothetical protein
VVAGGDAAAAHHDGLLRGALTEDVAELLRQLHRRLETGFCQVLGVGPVSGTRDVSSDTVHGFILATKTNRTARIEQQIAGGETGLDLGGVQQP